MIAASPVSHLPLAAPDRQSIRSIGANTFEPYSDVEILRADWWHPRISKPRRSTQVQIIYAYYITWFQHITNACPSWLIGVRIRFHSVSIVLCRRYDYHLITIYEARLSTCQGFKNFVTILVWIFEVHIWTNNMLLWRNSTKWVNETSSLFAVSQKSLDGLVQRAMNFREPAVKCANRATTFSLSVW